MNIWFAIVGAMFTIASFIPQTIRIVKYKDTKSFSIYFLILRIIGLTLVTTYTISIKQYQVAIITTFIAINMTIYLVYKIINIVKNGEKAHFHELES